MKPEHIQIFKDRMTSRLLEKLSGQPLSAETDMVAGLTDRELEVLQMIGEAKESKRSDNHVNAKE